MLLHKIEARLRETAEKWSADVKEKHHVPEGFFKDKDAEGIANGLIRLGGGAGAAAKRLSFYINRGGKNISDSDMGKLKHAQRILHQKVEKEKK